MAQWQLLSNHGRVLVSLARDPGLRLRDIAQICDITERSAHRIVSELVEEGYLIRKRVGSRNHYEIVPDVPIHDPLLGEHWVGEILAVLATSVAWANGRPRARPDGGAERRRGERRTDERAAGGRRKSD
jgi:MarR family